jgi:hypothetical protein
MLRCNIIFAALHHQDCMAQWTEPRNFVFANGPGRVENR